MYSPQILEYARKTFDDIVIPDEVVVSEGVACGDALVAKALTRPRARQILRQRFQPHLYNKTSDIFQ